MHPSIAFFLGALSATAWAAPATSPNPSGVLTARGLDSTIASIPPGTSPGCSASSAPPTAPAKLRVRQSEDSCPAPKDTTTCAPGFSLLCCSDEPLQGGLIVSGCVFMLISSTCPPKQTQCCYVWIKNILSSGDPDANPGWGQYCYNPYEISG